MVWKILPQLQTVISSKEELVAQLLTNRNLNDKTEIDNFFNPELSSFNQDFNLPNIDQAIERIKKAIANEEQIVIYGDYDADGICSTAILYKALTSLNAKVLPYLPHREKEGYGISKEGIDAIAEKGGKLIITVDNGIVAVEAAKHVKAKGLDLIITDHHVPLDDALPQALAIVHSTKFCGTGVIWCLVKKLMGEEYAHSLLDLVAIATICDMIPLTNANRALVKQGLKKLNTTTNVGLLALIKASAIFLGSIDSYHVGHIIGPRLNAMGRMEHSIDALRLLCTNDTEKAIKLAQVLSDTNDLKKQITSDAILSAKEILKSSFDIKNEKIIVVHSPEWIPGIIGLVAGRIAEEYQRPTIAISTTGLIAKGSARSVNGVNIVETLRSVRDLLIDVGGHPQAAGFTIETTNIEVFKQRIIEQMEKTEVVAEPHLDVEAVIDCEAVKDDWVKAIAQFEPFGVGNSKPTLASIGVKVSDLRPVGQSGYHLKLKCGNLDAIAFSFGHLLNSLHHGDPINVAYSLEMNKYNGSETLQLKVMDIEKI